MTAVVEKMPWSGRFTAWCQECKHGYGGGEVATRNWAYLHNENHHTP